MLIALFLTFYFSFGAGNLLSCVGIDLVNRQRSSNRDYAVVFFAWPYCFYVVARRVLSDRATGNPLARKETK